jgi:molybdopterin-containing oxidoreductase family membrane subunit
MTREDRLIRQMTHNSSRFYIWIVFLAAAVALGMIAYIIQYQKGLIVTGLRDQTSWGIYISTFVFWVGVSKGGTMISAILRVTNAEWRTPMTRLSEAITVLALLVGAPMIVADLGRPDRIFNLIRYGRIQSPLIWDFISVNTYLTACVIYFYLPLIPDLAILSQDPRLATWRRRLYRVLSLRWKNTPEQHALLERAIHVMAIIVIPLAVSVHTVVSWIFAMTLRPGWNSTIYGPYFVVGAIYSGAAAVIVCMWALRRTWHLEEYIQPEHFRKIGKLLLACTLVYFYFNVNEYLTVGYKLEGFERDLMESLFFGRFAPIFWSVQIIGVVAPILVLMLFLLVKPLHRYSVSAVGTASLLIVIGAWAKRFLIVVPTLQTPFLPAQHIPAEWTHYSPTWVEWAIVGGALAAFLLAYSLIAKLFPIVSLWETREHTVVLKPATEPKPRSVFSGVHAGPTIVVIGGLFLFVTGRALAVEKPKTPPAATAVTITYEIESPPEPVGGTDQQIPPGVSASLGSPAGLESTLQNPFSRRAREVKKPIPAVVIKAKLADLAGNPVAFKPVAFSVKTFFGTLSLGSRPTGADGIAKLKITDRRLGKYSVQASFAGDEQAAASVVSAEIINGERPAPALPGEGVLITPYPTVAISFPFALFFGIMWVVFTYVAYTVWRVRRAGHALTDDVRSPYLGAPDEQLPWEAEPDGT